MLYVSVLSEIKHEQKDIFLRISPTDLSEKM